MSTRDNERKTRTSKRTGTRTRRIRARARRTRTRTRTSTSTRTRTNYAHAQVPLPAVDEKWVVDVMLNHHPVAPLAVAGGQCAGRVRLQDVATSVERDSLVGRSLLQAIDRRRMTAGKFVLWRMNFTTTNNTTNTTNNTTTNNNKAQSRSGITHTR